MPVSTRVWSVADRESQDHEALLQELEDRADLGERMNEFYMRHNPDRVQNLASVLDRFAGREEDLCAGACLSLPPSIFLPLSTGLVYTQHEAYLMLQHSDAPAQS